MMRTLDKGMPMHDRVLTIQNISAHQSLTPEGYLLCKDVGLARTGTMDYMASEIFTPEQLKAERRNANDRVAVHRFADDVFNADFMASLEGKSVTAFHHPSQDVNPENWQQYEVGILLNPRRGVGADADLLIGDLLIKDPEAIAYARDQQPEISVGYQAEYQEVEEAGKSYWKQIPVFANHVTLLDSGRCGPRCAVKDHSNSNGAPTMRTRVIDKATLARRTAEDKAWFADWTKRMDSAIKAGDAKAIKAIMDEAEPEVMDEAPVGTGGEDTMHIHVGGGGNPSGPTRDEEAHGRIDEHDQRITAHDEDLAAIKKHVGIATDSADPEAEEMAKSEAPSGTDDAAIKSAKDSALYADSFQAARAGAELLVPGITLPAFTKDAAPKKTLDAVCALRKTALELANNQAEGRGIIESVHGKPLVLDGMKCGAVRNLFNAVVAVKKIAISKAAGGHTAVNARDEKKVAAVQTPAQMNEMHRKHYGRS